MSEQDPSNSEKQPTSVTSVSGGVNVDAQRDVTIGGDVVGRDKITQNTWTNIRHIIVSPWGLIGLAVIFAVTALIITGVIKLPTPLAFAPATEGQSLIIVADFEDRSGGKYQGIDPAQYIYEQLTAQAKKDNLDVRIERLRHTVDDNTVRPTGETYSATLVLWGWYDALTATPRIARINSPAKYISPEESLHLSMSQPGKVEVSLVKDLPQSSTYLALLIIGLNAYSKDEYKDALAYCSSALAVLPPDGGNSINPSDAYYCRGNVYWSQEAYDLALVELNKAIQLRPDFANAFLSRGNAYFDKGDYDQAIADFDKALQFKTDEADWAYYDRGFAYENKGNFDQALADYDKAIELNPDFLAAYNNRGIIYDERGDHTRAIADYSKAIEIKPFAIGYINRGDTYSTIGEYDKAIKDFDKAIQLEPDYIDAYNDRGLAYYRKGNLDQAITDYDMAIQLKPDYADAYYGRGNAYAAKGDPDRAIADYDKAIQLQPDNANVYYGRGNAYAAKADPDRAIADYSKVIQLRPGYANAYYGRGLAYKAKSQVEESVADFRKYLELSSDPTWRQAAQDQLKSLGAQ